MQRNQFLRNQYAVKKATEKKGDIEEKKNTKLVKKKEIEEVNEAKTKEKIEKQNDPNVMKVNVKWSDEENNKFIEMMIQKKSLQEMSKELKRTETSIQFRIWNKYDYHRTKENKTNAEIAKIYNRTEKEIEDEFKKRDDIQIIATENKTKNIEINKSSEEQSSENKISEKPESIKKTRKQKIENPEVQIKNRMLNDDTVKEIDILMQIKEQLIKNKMIEESEKIDMIINEKLKETVNIVLNTSSKTIPEQNNTIKKISLLDEISNKDTPCVVYQNESIIPQTMINKQIKQEENKSCEINNEQIKLPIKNINSDEYNKFMERRKKHNNKTT